MTVDAQKPATRAPVGLLLRLAAAGVFVAGIVLLVTSSHNTRTVSQVIDEINELALAKPQGGLIGTWWVSAGDKDPDDGQLLDFKVECGPVHIASRSARIIVNPQKDTFRFEMTDVVFARIPGFGEEETVGALRQLDRYVLGPLPYDGDIVADKGATRTPLAIGEEKRSPAP